MAQEKEYVDREGKVHTDLRPVDIDNIAIGETYKGKSGYAESIEHNKHTNQFLKEQSQNFGTTNMTLRNHALDFLKYSTKTGLPQFDTKKDEFSKRFYTISEATIYKFKDEMIKLWLEKTKNDVGDRAMPRRNMFIDTYLEFDGLSVVGIHLVRVRILPDGTQVYDLDPEMKMPHTQSAISIFFTGYDKDGVQYYTNTLVDDELMDKYYYKGKMKQEKYSCPFCHLPLSKLTKSEWVCESEKCIVKYQEGKPIVYDVGFKKVKDKLQLLQMKDVYKAEKNVRLFVCNLLDYYMNKDIYFVDGLTKEQARIKNEKDAKKNKPKKYMVCPIKVVRVNNRLEKKIFDMKNQFGSYEIARKRSHIVEAHFMRFRRKDHYTRLYGWINGCRTVDEKRAKLRELKRVDEEGFEEEDVYKWDEKHDCIYCIVDVHERCKDEGNPDNRTEVRVIQ